MPTDIVLLQPGMPVPRPELDDDNWPRVRGYELLTVIGTGGMGIVYMARQCDLLRTVALKMLRGLGQMDSEYRERLRAEAETVAKLQHQNIIQVFEIGTVEPQPGELHPSPFISFEFVDGGSLLSRTESPQSPEYAARIIEKIARAVHAAHRLGVIHRDLKPANVLLTRDGEPKVADFGLAKHFGSEVDSGGRYLTRAGVVMGTPAYMAPEQAAGEAITFSIDIYALGVILYELLTARVPFQGMTPVETMYLVRDQEPVSPRQLQPKLPRDLETICLKCLQKQIGNRYATAEELANDLANWREGRPILARPVGFIERTIRAAKRNPAIAALSVAVVLITLAGVSGVVWKWQEAQQHAEAAEAAATRANEETDKANEATRAERWERYRSHLVAASNALQLNNVVVARQALDTAPEEFRGWEWRSFYQQLDGSIHALRWANATTDHANFTPDGRWIWVLALGGKSRIWDTLERKEVRTFPSGMATGLEAISPDGKKICYRVSDTEFELRDVATDRVHRLTGHKAPMRTPMFSQDSTRITTASHEPVVRVWDVATGELREKVEFDEKASDGVIFDSNGDQAVAGYFDPPATRFWDIKTKRVIPLHGPEHNNYSIAFNREGTRGVTIATYPDNAFHLWELPACKRIASFKGHTNVVKTLTFSPDNMRIATGSFDQTARIWEASTGKSIAVLRDHRGWVNDVKFSPDGQRLLTASQDHTLRLWNGIDGSPLGVLRGHTGDVISAAYTPNGVIASCARDGTVRLWNPELAERNSTIRGHKSFVYGVAFHPDGERIASASWDGTIRLSDATTGRILWSRSYGEKQIVASVAFHPEGKLLASLGRAERFRGGGSVRLWDVETGNEVHRWEVPSDWRDSRVHFSPNGELLAVGGVDGRIQLWDMKSKAEVAGLQSANDAIRDLAFSPDAGLIASGHETAETGIRVWDVAKRAEIQVLRGHGHSVYSVAFSPDGKLLASGSTDGTARLWDTTTWKEVAVMKHGANVYCVAFTRDGNRLVSACADNTIRLWDVKTHLEVAELRGHEGYVHSIAFSPDGTRLVSGSGDTTLRIWDTLSNQDRSRAK